MPFSTIISVNGRYLLLTLGFFITLFSSLLIKVKDLCGASDDATVELSNQRKENSSLRIELNHMKSKVEEKNEKMRSGVIREEEMKEEVRVML